MLRVHILLAILTCTTQLSSLAQELPIYPSPMDIPLVLAGNFGEMRNNHFHSGIDIKTQGRVGIPLLSIQDGYVSRIKVSPYGYGYALYIDHIDGYTSVYAHMSKFNDTIAAYVHAQQYAEEKWAIEIYPEPGELPVLQGEIIGLSGNSGSSTGPHLHFEIRETTSEHPMNPQLFGIDIVDKVSPPIKGLRAYPLDAQSQVDQGSAAKSFVAEKGKSSAYSTKSSIKVSGSIGLGLHTYDLMSGTSNKYGVYRLEMFVDDILYYSHVMDELDFGNFRQVNCHGDYDLFKKNRWRYHKCFPAENNTLEIYEMLVNDGRLYVYEGDTLQVKFVASDIKGNKSELSCTLLGVAPPEEIADNLAGVYIDATSDNVYIDTGLVVRIPSGRIYEDFYLNPSREDRSSELGDRFVLHDRDVPLDDKIIVSIRAEKAIEESEHIIMQHKDARGRVKHLSTDEHDGWFEAENRNLGSYCLLEDKVAPHVTISGLSTKGKKNKVSLAMGDNLSGVTEFAVHIDGQWLLMSHNASMSKAWGKLSELNLSGGEHTAVVTLTDLAGNVTEKTVTFQY